MKPVPTRTPLLILAAFMSIGISLAPPVQASALQAAASQAYLPLVTSPGQASPEIGSCPVFPADNIWNTRVDTLPVHPSSASLIASIGAGSGLHADFGSGVWPPGSSSPIGIPFVVVPGEQPKVPVEFVWWPEESDPGLYPIPTNAPIEGGPDSDGDRHVLVLQQESCKLYELYAAYPQDHGGWEAGNGSVFDLRSHALRTNGWTSADAAGLAILPGLARFDEAAAGAIRHALRFTAPQTRQAHIWPARHHASNLTDSQYPPMGLRVRLRASYDLSGFSTQARVILQSLKTYGMILADNGSPWYISGAPDERWDNDVLHELGRVKGADFEAVDVSGLMIDPDSGQARQP